MVSPVLYHSFLPLGSGAAQLAARSPWWSPGAWASPGPPAASMGAPALDEAECGGEEGVGESQEGAKNTLTLPWRGGRQSSPTVEGALCQVKGWGRCKEWDRVRFAFLSRLPVAGTALVLKGEGYRHPGTGLHCAPAGTRWPAPSAPPHHQHPCN